ncbi:MAG: SMC-Scp complex subunit ScpB, partial [Gammaproteobacteria bacterium]|nr:SMC-Scp complex subunit ScpB [Gammaproteobacteria bacterium]
MQQPPLKTLLEAAIMAADGPIGLDRLTGMFTEFSEDAPGAEDYADALAELAQDYVGRGIELVEVAGGWRFQTRATCAPWINRLWEERKPRYSRALLETLAIIAYRQPITRAEIEDIRGVAVSSGIIKTLHERNWIKIVGHRDVPGRPAIFATTKDFLDYFNLNSLSQLPTLAELRDIDELSPDLFADFEAQAAEVEAAVAAEPDGEHRDEEGGTRIVRLVHSDVAHAAVTAAGAGLAGDPTVDEGPGDLPPAEADVDADVPADGDQDGVDVADEEPDENDDED